MMKKKFFLLGLAVSFSFSGCQSLNQNKSLIIGSNSNKGKKTLIYKSKEYFLTKTPNYFIEQDFNKIVEDSFLSVYNNMDFEIKKSFSYLINPKGASYPFSRVEVNCLVREDLSSTTANELCKLFFDRIDRKYKNLKKEIPD